MNLRLYNTATTVHIALRPSGTTDISTNPTLAAGDVKISKDGGAFANLTTLPTVNPASGGAVEVALSATEMSCSRAFIKFVDQDASKEWEDAIICIETYGHASSMHPQLGQLGVTDAMTAQGYTTTLATNLGTTNTRVSTGIPNVAPGASGGLPTTDASNGVTLRTLDAPFVHSGTAAAGAASTITLAAGASAVDDIYNLNQIKVYGGTGPGQVRTIIDYDGTTKVATVDRAWQTNPSASSTYAITQAAGPSLSTAGKVAASNLAEVWEVLMASITTANTIGKLIKDYLDAAVSTRSDFDFSTDGVKLASDGLDDIDLTEPSARPTDFREWMMFLFARFGNKVTQTTTQQKVYKSDDVTVIATMTCSEAAGTQTKGKA